MSWLVDGNGIIALAINSHPQYARAKAWFESLTATNSVAGRRCWRARHVKNVMGLLSGFNRR